MGAMTVDSLLHIAGHVKRPNQVKVVIPLHSPGRIGGRLMAEVNSCAEGFDWEQGRFILCTSKPLIMLEGWEADAITEEARKLQSPAGYASYKRIMHLEKLLKDNGIAYD